MVEPHVDVRDDQGAVVVDVAGDLEPVSAESLRNGLLGRQSSRTAVLIVDLSKVTSCDPAALPVLVRVKQAIAREGGRLVLVAPSYPVARALRTTGLARSLEIRSSAAAALGSCGVAGLPRQRTDGPCSASTAADRPVADQRGASTVSARGRMS